MKFFKIILISALCFAFSLSLSSCEQIKGLIEKQQCDHVDKNDNGVCDICLEDYNDGEDIDPQNNCQHRDADDNLICDKCGIDFTDDDECDENGNCIHYDGNNNGICDKCFIMYIEGAEHKHVFCEWIKYGDQVATTCDQVLFYRVCNCGDIEWKLGGYENHTLISNVVEPTCTANGYTENVCSVCGFSELTDLTAKIDHEYSTSYSYTDMFHWNECVHCGEKKDIKDHVPGEGGGCSVCGCSSIAGGHGCSVGKLCYDYDLRLVGKEDSVKISDLRGKIVVINFWGTWCSYCVSELPHFNDVASEYEDEVVVVAIHSTYRLSDAPGYISQYYSDSKIIFAHDELDPQNLVTDDYYTMLGGDGNYPMTLILDERGVITFKQVGYLTKAELETAIATAKS